jgi:hypothetical protein
MLVISRQGKYEPLLTQTKGDTGATVVRLLVQRCEPLLLLPSDPVHGALSEGPRRGVVGTFIVIDYGYGNSATTDL